MELPTQDRQPAMTRSGTVLALYGALALLALLISAGRGHVDLYRLDEEASLLIGPVLGVAIGLAVVLLSRLATHYMEWAQFLHQGFRSILGGLSHQEIAILALASGISEELLFRGALLPWIGIWPQAFLFAALHLGPGRRYLAWTILSFAVAVFFAYLASWTGNLGAPIAAHITINYLNLRFIVGRDLSEPRSADEDTSAPPVSAA